MRQSGDGFGFAFEPLESVAVLRQVPGKYLIATCHSAASRRWRTEIHLAHAARAEHAGDFVQTMRLPKARAICGAFYRSSISTTRGAARFFRSSWRIASEARESHC